MCDSDSQAHHQAGSWRLNPLSLAGTIDRVPFVCLGLLLGVAKYFVDLVVAEVLFHRPWSAFNYLASEQVSMLVTAGDVDRLFYATMLAVALLFIWIGVVLTGRRGGAHCGIRVHSRRLSKQRRQMASRLYAAIDSSETMPQRCAYAREREHLHVDVRQFVYHSHRILFTVEDRFVVILHVRHGRMDAIRTLRNE